MKVREGLACEPRAAPLWAERLPPFVSLPVWLLAISMHAKVGLTLIGKMENHTFSIIDGFDCVEYMNSIMRGFQTVLIRLG